MYIYIYIYISGSSVRFAGLRRDKVVGVAHGNGDRGSTESEPLFDIPVPEYFYKKYKLKTIIYKLMYTVQGRTNYQMNILLTETFLSGTGMSKQPPTEISMRSFHVSGISFSGASLEQGY